MSKNTKEYTNTYRILWIIIDAVIVLIAAIWIHYSNSISSTTDYLTYWGFIASILAGLATIFEIANSSANSKRLSDEINERTISIEESANELKNTNKIISISECGVLLDQIIDQVDSELFNEAVIYIREIRKIILKTELKELLDEKIEVDSKIQLYYDYYETERRIEAYRSAKKGMGRIAKYQIVRAKIFYANFRTMLLKRI